MMMTMMNLRLIARVDDDNDDDHEMEYSSSSGGGGGRKVKLEFQKDKLRLPQRRHTGLHWMDVTGMLYGKCISICQTELGREATHCNRNFFAGKTHPLV